MEPKFTKGPQTAKFYPVADEWHIHTSDGSWIASIHVDGEPEAAEADAHLYAAAPDMYAALELVVDRRERGMINMTYEELVAVDAAIDAALSRARGETK